MAMMQASTDAISKAADAGTAQLRAQIASINVSNQAPHIPAAAASIQETALVLQPGSEQLILTTDATLARLRQVHASLPFAK